MEAKSFINKKYKGIDEFSWNEKNLSQRIIHLQIIANQLLDAFNDAAKVIKLHILTVNTPTRIIVSEEKPKGIASSESHLKRGRPIVSKDVVIRKMRGIN